MNRPRADIAYAAARHSRLQRHRPAGVLHPLAAVLSLAQRQPGRQGQGAIQRRRNQRLAIAQRLLDPLPDALVAPAATSERFWTVLRWGGLGLIVARLLHS